ncbi:MAG: hypothetical protein U0V48_13270 [Anaerolineales bacterium]
MQTENWLGKANSYAATWNFASAFREVDLWKRDALSETQLIMRYKSNRRITCPSKI